MSHLTEVELVDLLDGCLPIDRGRHVDACASCRERADDLRLAIDHASDASIPEPSPLFWEHFSARVRAGISTSANNAPTSDSVSGSWLGWLRHEGFTWVVAGALVIALIVGAAWQVSAPSPLSPQVVERTSTPPRLDNPDLPDADADPAWAVVRTVADEVQWNDAVVSGLDAQPGAAERAVQSLSSAERSELVRLLLAEAKRPGA
jgi:hypothetical protein